MGLISTSNSLKLPLDIRTQKGAVTRKNLAAFAAFGVSLPLSVLTWWKIKGDPPHLVYQYLILKIYKANALTYLLKYIY